METKFLIPGLPLPLHTHPLPAPKTLLIIQIPTGLSLGSQVRREMKPTEQPHSQVPGLRWGQPGCGRWHSCICTCPSCGSVRGVQDVGNRGEGLETFTDDELVTVKDELSAASRRSADVLRVTHRTESPRPVNSLCPATPWASLPTNCALRKATQRPTRTGSLFSPGTALWGKNQGCLLGLDHAF